MALKGFEKKAINIIKELGGVGAPAGRSTTRAAMAMNKRILGSKSRGILFTHRPATASNALSGIGLTKLGTALLGIGIVGKAVATGVQAYNAPSPLKPPGEDIGSLSTLSMDAEGQVIRGQRNLGATGDLVFGLHKGNRSY